MTCCRPSSGACQLDAPVSERPPPPDTWRAEALARRRVPLGFVFGVLVLYLAQPTLKGLAWGAAIAVAGELLRIWAAGHLNKAREVTASGPYRWFAHPLYLGSAIMGVGLAFAAGSLFATAVTTAYLVVMIAAAVKSEEAYLRKAFGDRYDRYRSGARDASRRFSLAQAIANREHRTVAGLLVAWLLLVLKATYNGVFWR